MSTLIATSLLTCNTAFATEAIESNQITNETIVEAPKPEAEVTTTSISTEAPGSEIITPTQSSNDNKQATEQVQPEIAAPEEQNSTLIESQAADNQQSLIEKDELPQPDAPVDAIATTADNATVTLPDSTRPPAEIFTEKPVYELNEKGYAQTVNGDKSTACQIDWTSYSVFDQSLTDWTNNAFLVKTKCTMFPETQGGIWVEHFALGSGTYCTRVPIFSEHSLSNVEVKVFVPSEYDWHLEPESVFYLDLGTIYPDFDETKYTNVRAPSSYLLVLNTLEGVYENGIATFEIPLLEAKTPYVIQLTGKVPSGMNANQPFSATATLTGKKLSCPLNKEVHPNPLPDTPEPTFNTASSKTEIIMKSYRTNHTDILPKTSDTVSNTVISLIVIAGISFLVGTYLTRKKIC